MNTYHNGPGNYDNTEVPAEVLARIKATTGLDLYQIHTVKWGWNDAGVLWYIVYPMLVGWFKSNREWQIDNTTQEPADWY